MQQASTMSDFASVSKIELDMQISTAKMYPRNISQSIAKAIQLATRNQEIAESCIYKLPPKRDENGVEKEIKGHSIRLAEIMAQCWGNLHAASRVVRNDNKVIVAEAVAWDLESNLKVSSEVAMSIMTKNGKTYGTSMQTVISNAACAKAIRNAIFKVIPKSLVDEVESETKKAAIGDTKNLQNIQQKVNFLLDRFQTGYGISVEKILGFFNKTKDTLDANDIETMMGIGTALKQGDISKEEAFTVFSEIAVQEDELQNDILDLNQKLMPRK